jgi:hypothetical protein
MYGSEPVRFFHNLGEKRILPGNGRPKTGTCPLRVAPEYREENKKALAGGAGTCEGSEAKALPLH